MINKSTADIILTQKRAKLKSALARHHTMPYKNALNRCYFYVNEASKTYKNVRIYWYYPGVLRVASLSGTYVGHAAKLRGYNEAESWFEISFLPNESDEVFEKLAGQFFDTEGYSWTPKAKVFYQKTRKKRQ